MVQTKARQCMSARVEAWCLGVSTVRCSLEPRLRLAPSCPACSRNGGVERSVRLSKIAALGSAARPAVARRAGRRSRPSSTRPPINAELADAQPATAADRWASSTRSARRWLAVDQPTILRLQASGTTARYRNPAAVGTYVMSATQSWSGPKAVNSRSTRSGAGRASLSCRVVGPPCRSQVPDSPASRISRAIRL